MIRLTAAAAARAICLTIAAGAAATAHAQPTAPPRAFVTRRGTDTLLVEQIERGADSAIISHLTFRNAGPLAGLRISATFTPAPDGRVRRAQIQTTPPGAPAPAPAQRITLTFGAAPADSIELQINGASQRQPGVAGALPYLNLCVADLELILHRARVLARGQTTPTAVPLFIAPNVPTATATVTRLGADSAVLTLGGVDLRARVSPEDHVLGLAVPAQGITIDAADPRAIPALRAPAPPPSYAPPPGAPYAAEEVRVPTPGGFTLAGTLTRPTNARGPVPIVVTITGSGPQERDERLDGIPGYALFRQIADTLGRRGIGVLRLDDRGVGASGGTFATATSRDFADDVRAALAWLRARASARGDVDAARLALLGHSEGGLVAPMVAADDPAVAAVVLLAGPAYDGRRVLSYQFRNRIIADPTLSPPRRDALLTVADRVRDSVLASNAWMRYFDTYDPLATARRVRTPVLVVHGATDRQVTPEQADTLADALRGSGNGDVTVRIFPATNHLFLADASGAPSGYAALPSKAVRPEVLGTVADWIAARLAHDAAH